MSISYDGRRFRRMGASDGVVASYRQDGDLVWADFSGGRVLRGTLCGLRDAHDVLDFAYTMVLASGEIISGHCVNTPRLREDGWKGMPSTGFHGMILMWQSNPRSLSARTRASPGPLAPRRATPARPPGAPMPAGRARPASGCAARSGRGRGRR